MVMKHKDGTLYSCLTGFAFDGPRKGEHLTPWPTIVTDWGWTMKHYPDGVAYHMYEKYKPTELPTKLSDDSVKSRAAVDKRLPADEMVLGVAAPNGRARPRAYRLADLDAMGRFAAVKDVFECGVQAVIFWDRDSKTATAYRAIAEKRAKTEKLSEEGE